MLGKAGIRLPPGPRRTLEDFARSPPATDRRRSLTGSPHRPQPRSAPWRNPVRRRFRTRRRAVRVRWAPGCIGQRPLDDLVRIGAGPGMGANRLPPEFGLRIGA